MDEKHRGPMATVNLVHLEIAELTHPGGEGFHRGADHTGSLRAGCRKPAISPPLSNCLIRSPLIT